MTIINIRGISVDMLLDISPGVYGTYVTTDREVINQLINLCMNSTYVTMVANIL